MTRDLNNPETSFLARLRAVGTPAAPPAIRRLPATLPTTLPVAGSLAGVHPLELEGGLAVSSWLFRRRLQAVLAGDAERSARYACPFAPA